MGPSAQHPHALRGSLGGHQASWGQTGPPLVGLGLVASPRLHSNGCGSFRVEVETAVRPLPAGGPGPLLYGGGRRGSDGALSCRGTSRSLPRTQHSVRSIQPRVSSSPQSCWERSEGRLARLVSHSFSGNGAGVRQAGVTGWHEEGDGHAAPAVRLCHHHGATAAPGRDEHTHIPARTLS